MKLVCVLICAAAVCGCGNTSGQMCRSDSDCGGQVCTRVGECASQADLVTILTKWTINGAAPTPDQPAACSGIDSLEVSYLQSGSPIAGFAPVPCDIGVFRVDKMPRWLDGVEVTARDAQQHIIARGDAALPGDATTTVTVGLITR